MKRITALVALLALCITLCACSCVADTSDSADTKVGACTELTIRKLMEQNLDCYFLYYVEPLPVTTQRNSDGYLGTDGSIYKTFSEFENLIKTTYVKESADKLLNYPSKETPLYKGVQDSIFVKPDVAEFEKYDIIWDDSYTITIDSSTDTQCNFTLNTTDLDNKPYTTKGSAKVQNGKWLLADIIY